MRSWLFRRRVSDTSAGSSGYAIAELVPRLGGVLDVEQVRAEGHALGFGGRLLLSPAAALTELIERFRPLGYTPFLQEAAGLTWVRALPFVDVQMPSKPRINILLFVLTVVSTIVAGSGGLLALHPPPQPPRPPHRVAFCLPPPRHPGHPRVRPLLRGPCLWRLGQPAVLHSRAAALPLRHPRRHHPDALARARSQLALRHRRGRAPRGARRCPPRTMDRARLVEGGRAARR